MTVDTSASATSAPWTSSVHVGLTARDRGIEVPARHPAAGRRERDHRHRAATRSQLQRDVPAERVADEVRGIEARIVHRPLDRVDDAGLAGRGVERRATGVPGERRSEHVMATLQRFEHQLPCPPRVHEPVQAHHRRPFPATMNSSEPREHRPNVPAVPISMRVAPSCTMQTRIETRRAVA